MSYTRGELQFGRGGIYDSDKQQYSEWVAELPHSCGEWQIGTKSDVEQLIADLRLALERWPTREPLKTYEVITLDGKTGNAS